MFHEWAHFEGSPQEIARNENYWAIVRRAFTLNEDWINLNNGGVSPCPTPVMDAVKRHMDFANLAPVYAMWEVQVPQREAVREKLAGLVGCDKEELALTRNVSEGLQTCQFNLPMQSGGEVLTTTHDYPRMMWAFQQRQQREGIVLRPFRIPTPAEDFGEVVRLFEQNITPRTQMILVSHVNFVTGQVMPVREIVALGRKHGIPVIVDGAHAIAHLDFKISDLDCDYYSSSLHKWLCAPHGTGMFYVRRDKIADLWPRLGAPVEKQNDIRKFEEIGTHPAAPYLAITEAIDFHLAIGSQRKLARLLYLRDYCAKRLMEHKRIRLCTSLKPGFAIGLLTFEVEGIDPNQLKDWLWKEHHVITAVIEYDQIRGIRLAPNVYTTIHEIDRFCEAMNTAIRIVFTK